MIVESDPDAFDPAAPAPRTEFFRDASKSIIARNDSPDINFDASINPYRGCEHGCIYCYARPYHEYLGYSAGLDFESKIMVKESAPELLRKELSSPKWKPQVLGMSGVTDPYQPVERKLKITRRCLEVLVEFRNPVVVVTKNHLVTRDIDLLAELARHSAAAVMISVTTLDRKLARIMEPRTSIPKQRLAAIRALTEAGIPTGVLVAPVIPGLNDTEIPAILKAAAEAGATQAGYTVLRLPHAVGPLFEQWLDQHMPDRKQKILNRVKSMRSGQLSDSRFGRRMKGEGVWAEHIKGVFNLACRKSGFQPESKRTLPIAEWRPPREAQLELRMQDRS